MEENFTSQYIRGNRGQIATGGGSAHLDEQLTCVDIPSISRPHFLKLERALGTMFENIVAQGLLSADRKQRQMVILNNSIVKAYLLTL